MSIYDGNVTITPQTAEQKAGQAAVQIFNIANRTLNGMDSALKKIRNQLSKGGGKAAIVAEISAEDATELQNFYDAVKLVVETYSPIEPDDL